MTNQTINLRNYQQEAVDIALKSQNGVLVLPTGTGKSLVIAGICKQIQEPILILQPSKEILEQNFEKIKVFTNEDIGIYSASKNKKQIHRITLATIGSIKDLEQFRQFKILLIDESHLVDSKAGRYCEFIEEMGFKKIIGLTATPYRLKAWREGFSWQFLHRSRPKIFEKILYIYQIKQAFEEGFLCRISYFKYEYDLTQLAESNLDYREDSVVKTPTFTTKDTLPFLKSLKISSLSFFELLLEMQYPLMPCLNNNSQIYPASSIVLAKIKKCFLLLLFLTILIAAKTCKCLREQTRASMRSGGSIAQPIRRLLTSTLSITTLKKSGTTARWREQHGLIQDCVIFL